jgi:aminobenzoyl-glutamate utilization protein A
MQHVSGDVLEAKLAQFISEIEGRLGSWRRELHQFPEVGWTEYQTTYKIATLLSPLGFKLSIGKEALDSSSRMGVPDPAYLKQYETRARNNGVPDEMLIKMEGGHTGLVARWETGRKGPHLAFRFDIDALPIPESDVFTHAPFTNDFRSKYEGTMHACAHDGHTAIGLGLAHFIHEFQDGLSGSITLLFQPAEEGCRGAKAMVEKGWLDQVDYFVSGHIGIRSLNVGDIAATSSGFLATTKLDVTYKGISAHAGVAPEEGKNALLAACAAVQHLYAITRHSQGSTRINVGKLEAGSGRNIIADYAKFEMETRGETTELNEYMLKEAKRIIASVAQLYDLDVTVDILGEGKGANSDNVWVSILQGACQPSKRIHHVIPHMEIGGSEDVTYMMNRVQERGGKATYLIFGTPLTAGHHHPQFDYKEDVLSVAVETLARLMIVLPEQ